MNTWFIQIVFKNGHIENGFVKSDLSNSDDVAVKFFSGNENDMNGISGINGSNLIYKLNEVVCAKILDKPMW